MKEEFHVGDYVKIKHCRTDDDAFRIFCGIIEKIRFSVGGHEIFEIAVIRNPSGNLTTEICSSKFLEKVKWEDIAAYYI